MPAGHAAFAGITVPSKAKALKANNTCFILLPRAGIARRLCNLDDTLVQWFYRSAWLWGMRVPDLILVRNWRLLITADFLCDG